MRRYAIHLAVVIVSAVWPAVPVVAQERDNILLDERVLRQAVVNPQTATRETTKATVERYPLQGKVTQAELVRLSVKEGLLDVTAGSDMPVAAQPVRVEVEGSAATWVVRKRTVGQVIYTTVSQYDFSAPDDQTWQVDINVRQNYFMLNAQSGETNTGVRVRLTQQNNQLRLIVYEGRRSIFNVSAASVQQLRRENPQQVRQYLEPALRKITGGPLLKPGPADVYRAFETIQPDPEVARQVMGIVIRLDAESFNDRERASGELAKLGPPAVLAVLRLDRSLFSAEARTRLISFLAAHGSSTLDPKDSANDPHFLVDCLDDEDAKVRSAAKAALEKLLERPVKFDVSLSGSERLKAVDAVRRELATKAQPPRDSIEAR